MDKTAIYAIAEMAEPNIIEHNGHKYTDKELHVIPAIKKQMVSFSTLNGMLDTLAQEINKFISSDEKLIIHVECEAAVTVLSPICDQDGHRDTIYAATAELPEYHFGRYMSYEEMVIALKSKFVENDDLNRLVQLMGTITTENASTIADDGFTQTVTVKKGVVLKENKAVNPYFKLIPYRTFLETEQPESTFLLRIRDGSASLYEADGGAWKLTARSNVKKYITNYLKGISETAIDSVLIVE